MGRKIKIRRDGAWVPADEGSLDNVIKSTTVDKISASTTAPSSPTPGDIWFDTSALPEELAPSSIVWKETPTGAVNGTNTAFSTAQPYVSGSLQVFINGLAESSFVTESSPGSGGFTLSPAPLTGDNINVQYQVRVTATGNADTVDGYHANATPTANNIPVLDSNGKMPTASLGGAWTAWTPTVTPYSGTFTAVTGSGRYTQIGKTVHFSLRITQTSIGSASGFTFFTLPVPALYNPTNDTVGYGREDALTGSLLQCRAVSTTSAAVIKYDNTAIVANGAQFNLKGTYEVA